MTYSVAIRTLGLAPEILKRELVSIFNQTVKPDKVILYIAHGYKIPDFRVADEQYVYVEKGMVAQRALDYHEIDSEYIMLLDDDIELAPDSAEKLLNSLKNGAYDCIAIDQFENRKDCLRSKIYGAITIATYPVFWNRRNAFHLRRSAAFNYINNPKKDVYPSEYAAGGASLWRKSVLLAIHLEHELWLDKLGFAYCDDMVEFNKLPKNGYKLAIHYNSGCKHLDAKTASRNFYQGIEQYRMSSRGQYMVWHRCCYNLPKSGKLSRIFTIFAFITKVVFLFFGHIVLSIWMRDIKIAPNFLLGYYDGYKLMKTPPFNNLAPYQL